MRRLCRAESLGSVGHYLIIRINRIMDLKLLQIPNLRPVVIQHAWEQHSKLRIAHRRSWTVHGGSSRAKKVGHDKFNS